MHRKALLVKKLLKEGSRSPLTPLKQVLDKFIKGCETAIYNTSLLAQENNILCLFIVDSLLKKKHSWCLITSTDGLLFEEARDLILLRSNELQASKGGSSSSALPTLERPRRALPRCMNCGIQGYKRTSCQVPNYP